MVHHISAIAVRTIMPSARRDVVARRGFVSVAEVLIRNKAAIDGDYRRHSAAARELAHAYFDSAEILPRMLEASF